MCSIRNLLAISTLGLLIAGCTDVRTNPPNQLSSAPIIEDDAMALRQWDQSIALYANGSSVAYPFYFNYAPRRDLPEIEAAVLDPLLFTAQTIALPVLMVINPPWQEVVYRGVYTPPTYTAVPQTPNDAAGYAAKTY